MPIDPYKKYRPTNKIGYRYVPVTRAHVSGKISSGAHISQGIEVSGSIMTRHVCNAYDITITYDGPADIGDRRIISKRIPNHSNDDGIARQASQNTGIYSAYTNWHALATCLSVITCTYCCTINAIGESINARDRRLKAKIEELACDRMSDDIAKMMKEADELITERIDYKKSQAAPIAPGNVVLTQEQFKALVEGRQLAQDEIPPPPAEEEKPVSAVIHQYSKPRGKDKGKEDARVMVAKQKPRAA